MSDKEQSPTNESKDGDEHYDEENNRNGPQNGDEDKEEAVVERAGDDSRSPSRDGSEHRSKSRSRSKTRSRSRSRSKSAHKKKKSHRRSRSGSRSRGHRHRSHRKRSRSHSRSRSPSGSFSKRRRHSPSPTFGKSRFYGAREAPPPSRCLGVFGMSIYTDEKQLKRHFSRYGEIESVQVVFDRQTGRSRGFGFIYFVRMEDAIRAKDDAVGTEIDGQRVRIDFSVTKGPHAPTPGAYMGRRRDGPDRYGSPRNHRRSRSYSYSPRR